MNFGGILGYISITGFIILVSTMNAKKNIYIQKMLLFHRLLNEDNIVNFRLNEKVKPDIKFINYSEPNINVAYMKNSDYQILIRSYERDKKYLSLVKNGLIIIGALGAIISIMDGNFIVFS